MPEEMTKGKGKEEGQSCGGKEREGMRWEGRDEGTNGRSEAHRMLHNPLSLSSIVTKTLHARAISTPSHLKGEIQRDVDLLLMT